MTFCAMAGRASGPRTAAAARDHRTLCLQLQNCLMLINTILVEQTIAQHQLLGHFSAADYRGLSPLFYEHVNPYGLFELDLDRPSGLEAA